VSEVIVVFNVGSHVTLSFARRNRVSWNPLHTGYSLGVAALLTAFGCSGLQNATAEGDTRTLSFHHIHTNEDLTVTYKVNGRYDEEALKKINVVMRDWRKNQTIAMDPHTIDILWDVHREVGAKAPIWIICGYRSPDTNAMLRQRSSGVAKSSQHMLGKAVDYYIPGVPLDQLREAGLRAHRGGVGYYPTSGSPFVHMDTGGVRHWPHMPDAQMAKVMAKGPLRGGSDHGTQVAALSANPIAPLSKLMGFAANAPQAESAAPATPTESKTVKPVAIAANVPLPRPKAAPKPAPVTYEVASFISKPVPLPPARSASLAAPAQASPNATPKAGSNVGSNAVLAANAIVDQRGVSQGSPEPTATQTAPARTAAPSRRPAAIEVASADPAATASLAPWPLPERNERATGALAYAPATDELNTRPAALRTSAAAITTVAEPDTTIAVKRSGSRPSIISSAPATMISSNVQPGARFNEPWIRAMIVSPSAQNFMSTSMMGAPDYRTLGTFLQKPTASVMMTFNDDPYLGMSTERFGGSAVVFVSTVTFNQRTASLR
jgi:uncharacterized protein YcbK (DUF882 family)